MMEYAATRIETEAAALKTTLWSPGFNLVISTLYKRYKTLDVAVRTSLDMSEKHHYACVKEMIGIRQFLKDVYEAANEPMPETVLTKFHIRG